MKKIKLILSCLLATFVFACASSKLPPEINPEVWESAKRNPELYISQLEEKRPAISSFAARYKLKMKVSNKWYTLKQLALIKYPNLIRMEFSSSFGVAQALMVSNEERVNFYLLKEKQYYTASPTAENFFKLLGLRVEAQDLNDLLLNQYLCTTDTQKETVTWDNKLNLIIIKQQQKERDREILYYVNPKVESIIITRIFNLTNQQELLRAHYSDYRIEEEIIFPREVSLRVPKEGIELILQAKDIEFNVKELGAESFQFHPRFDARETNLELLREQAAILLKRLS
jgi:outer membrane lipoprotein-sorting protein